MIITKTFSCKITSGSFLDDNNDNINLQNLKTANNRKEENFYTPLFSQTFAAYLPASKELFKRTTESWM